MKLKYKLITILIFIIGIFLFNSIIPLMLMVFNFFLTFEIVFFIDIIKNFSPFIRVLYAGFSTIILFCSFAGGIQFLIDSLIKNRRF